MMQEVQEEWSQLYLMEHMAPEIDSDQWFIPRPIAESIRTVLGCIDLDPMSCEDANEVVQAKKIYTIKDNGLLKPWKGRVYLNPPYSRGNISRAVDKFAAHIRSGEIKQAITLTNSSTDTDWYHVLDELASARCIPGERIKFWGPNPQRYGPRNSQTFFYFTQGTKVEPFMREFQRWGQCRSYVGSWTCGGRGEGMQI